MKKTLFILLFAMLLSHTAFASVEEVINLEYQHTFETKISNYTYEYDNTVLSFGYEVPLIVHYNDSYLSESKYPTTIEVKEITVSEDGVPTINATGDAQSGDRIDIGQTIRYQTSDGVYAELETSALNCLVKRGKFDIIHPLLNTMQLDEPFRNNTIISIEVWLHQ